MQERNTAPFRFAYVQLTFAAVQKIFRYLVINLHWQRQIIVFMTQDEFVRQVQSNQGILQKICRLYAQTQPDREDLFQEIVVQLWKALPKFRGESKFSTWMYRVALNTAISDFRKKKRGPHVVNAAIASAEMPHEETSEEEQLNSLHAAISLLPEIDKAIVMLYLEDRSYEEMEEILGINTNNLRVKMNRIKEKLRQLTKNLRGGREDMSYGT